MKNLIPILLIGIVLISGCISEVDTSNNDVEVPNNLNVDKNTESLTKNICNSFNESATDYIDKCNQIFEPSDELCEDITRNWFCYTSLAIKKNDVSYCSKISSVHDNEMCYKYFALKYKDSTLCSNIPDGYEKDHCLDIATSCKDCIIKEKNLEDIDSCTHGSEDYDKHGTKICYKNFIDNYYFTDIEICNKMITNYIDKFKIPSDSELRAIQNDCYVEVAVANKDITICDYIDIEDRADTDLNKCILNAIKAQNGIPIYSNNLGIFESLQN